MMATGSRSDGAGAGGVAGAAAERAGSAGASAGVVWHPHVAAGAEQQAPVSALGVGSPQQGASRAAVCVAVAAGRAEPQQAEAAGADRGSSGDVDMAGSDQKWLIC
jgi:hypothetical protein